MKERSTAKTPRAPRSENAHPTLALLVSWRLILQPTQRIPTGLGHDAENYADPLLRQALQSRGIVSVQNPPDAAYSNRYVAARSQSRHL